MEASWSSETFYLAASLHGVTTHKTTRTCATCHNTCCVALYFLNIGCTVCNIQNGQLPERERRLCEMYYRFQGIRYSEYKILYW